jgi:microsomal dipeptidase-like Zn-dependent dipeptidase
LLNPPEDSIKLGEGVMEWIVKEGYPQEEIDKCGEHFWLRYWETDELS